MRRDRTLNKKAQRCMIVWLLLAVMMSVSAFYAQRIRVGAQDLTGAITLKLKEPVEGRAFEVYQIEDKDRNYTIPFQDLPVLQKKNADAAKEVESYIDGSKVDFSAVKKTFANTETMGNLEQGLYLVRQTQAPEGYEKIESFLVDIPHTTEEQQLQYTVECSPKVEKIQPAETPKPTKKPSENGQTNMAADRRIFYGAGTALAGFGILAIVLAVKKGREENEEDAEGNH